MQRMEAIEAVYPHLKESIVVTIMGAVAWEMQNLGHQPNFFYMQHSMGLASSMGLGIALTRPELPVVVLDGDGSILMNLGSLTTMARYHPKNLLHIVFDNESLLSVGGFPTATATGTDIAGMARAAGIPHATTVRTIPEFVAAFEEARACGRDDDDRRESRGDQCRPPLRHRPAAPGKPLPVPAPPARHPQGTGA